MSGFFIFQLLFYTLHIFFRILIFYTALHTCPDGYTSYFATETKFCLKMVKEMMTRSAAKYACANVQGWVASLIEDEKHNNAGQLAEEVFHESNKGACCILTLMSCLIQVSVAILYK